MTFEEFLKVEGVDNGCGDEEVREYAQYHFDRCPHKDTMRCIKADAMCSIGGGEGLGTEDRMGAYEEAVDLARKYKGELYTFYSYQDENDNHMISYWTPLDI